jgi:hypothetical protein
VALVTASGFEKKPRQFMTHSKKPTLTRDKNTLFGGSEIGAVDVEAAVGISCESLTATVRPAVPLPNAQRALAATSIQGLRLHTNWRQPNTTGQRSEFLNAAAAYLTKKGVTGVLPSAIKLRNLRLTKVRLDGPNALVGSITFKDSTTKRNLFLVLGQGETHWDVDMASYHVTKDLEDYVDEAEEDFVDQLDLDSDGVDEIVTISYYYESWDYAIYKEKDGKWEKVYKGGGGGC